MQLLPVQFSEADHFAAYRSVRETNEFGGVVISSTWKYDSLSGFNKSKPIAVSFSKGRHIHIRPFQ